MTGFVLGILTGVIPMTFVAVFAFRTGCRITEDSYTEKARARDEVQASLSRDTWTAGSLEEVPELTPQLHPIVEAALPWHDTVSWGQPKVRRGWLAAIRQWMTDPLRVGALVDAGLTMTPIGAEPALGQVRVGVTGRSLAPRTSGNAAPLTNAQPLPQAGAPAGSLLKLLDAEPKPGEPGHRDYPWIVLPRGHAVIRECRNSGRTVSWKDIAARLRAERIHTPTAEFRAIVDATWTPDEALALGAWKCDSCATGRDGEPQHVSCSGCSCPCQLVAVA